MKLALGAWTVTCPVPVVFVTLKYQPSWVAAVVPVLFWVRVNPQLCGQRLSWPPGKPRWSIPKRFLRAASLKIKISSTHWEARERGRNSQATQSATALIIWVILAAFSASPSAGMRTTGAPPGTGGPDGAWVAVGTPV